MSENTLGGLPDLINVFGSPGPFYILVSVAKIQQEELWHVTFLTFSQKDTLFSKINQTALDNDCIFLSFGTLTRTPGRDRGVEGGGSQWVGEKGFTELEHFFEKMQTLILFFTLIKY